MDEIGKHALRAMTALAAVGMLAAMYLHTGDIDNGQARARQAAAVQAAPAAGAVQMSAATAPGCTERITTERTTADGSKVTREVTKACDAMPADAPSASSTVGLHVIKALVLSIF